MLITSDTCNKMYIKCKALLNNKKSHFKKPEDQCFDKQCTNPAAITIDYTVPLCPTI